MNGTRSSLQSILLACLAILSMAGSVIVSTVPYSVVGAEGAPVVDWEVFFGVDHAALGVSADSSGVYAVEDDPERGHTVHKYDVNGHEAWARQLDDSLFRRCVAGICAWPGGVCVVGGKNSWPEIGSGDYAGGYLRQYDAAGNVTEYPIGKYGAHPCAVAADSTGVYVAGYVHEAVEEYVDGQFVARYDANGNEVWVRLDDSYESTSIAAYSGSIYVAGRAGDEGFIRKYDAAGNEVWERLAGFVDDVSIKAVSADSSGLYVAGDAGDDAFVRKYDSDGDVSWTVHLTGAYENATGVSVYSGAVYVAGNKLYVLEDDFIPGYCVWINKYDTAGKEIWTGEYSCAAYIGVDGLCACSSGIYVAETWEGEGAFYRLPIEQSPDDTTQPTAVTDLAATTSTASSVTLTWTAPGDDGSTGTAATHDIRYSTAAITEANWASTTKCTGESKPKAAGSAETFTVAGLSPDTTYHFALKTADEVPNWSGLSNVVSKKTEALADTTPPAAVTDLAAPTVTTTSVTLTWLAPGDDGSTGTASTYDIRYSTAAITEANWASASQCAGEPSPKAAGTSETFTVTGLSPDATYYFAIKAADEVPNWSGLSNVVSKKTGVAPPPSAFAVGDRVITTATIKVRTSAALGDNYVDTLPEGNIPKGSTGKVVGGPEVKDNHTWWKIEYDACKITGWSAADYVVLVAVPDKSVPAYFSPVWVERTINWTEVYYSSYLWYDRENDQGYCLRFVANAFMLESNPPAAGRAIWGTATEAASALPRFDQEPQGWEHAPVGALILFAGKGDNGAGHVGIYLGDGKMVHAHGSVKENTVTEAQALGKIGCYIGWSYPPEKWLPDEFRERPDLNEAAAELAGIDPGNGKRGQHLTVTITGTNLAGATAVSFGSGVTVQGVSVVSDTEINVEISIDGNADLGKRDVSVTNPWGTATMTDGFEVVDSSSPGICSAGVPGAPSGMIPVFVVLGLGFGVWHWIVRRNRRSATAGGRA